ncbi:peptidase S8/S53 domain-containing protein [Stachybotrys elegans]|uniref:Peptidase S8/S53 domain-containing protein n=1 Tax=Stachybotrys elegans TaxID=80388 RepID=A0A8K0SVH3_9HYPO|nr:peptidase S8/S53 domain-containing protein [Stachybotrys elegans]
MAARYGLDNSISVLLQHGAKIDPVTKTGWTPLMLASERGYKSTINILLERNASRSAKNGDGYNSLQIAAHAGHQISTLLEYRHVAPSAVVNTSDEADKGGLVPPDRTRNMRTPSPAPGANIEVESEFYALSDGIIAETSVPKPENSKKFQSFLKTLEQTWYRKIHWTPDDDNPLPRRDWPGPVKIAILDTGIDLEHPDFSKPPERRSKDGKKAAQQIQEIPQRDRIKAWKSFTGGPEDDVTDSDGHGTHIAGLILTIAPRAELYIARVSTQSHTRDDEAGDSKRRSGELRPIQKALEWAMEQDVDIVNLSLGFARESSYELTTLLEEANHREIIVIAAAANHGNSNAIAWPARDRDLAICITSGDEFDHPSRFAPTPPNDLPIFMTYGENIYSHWPTKLGGGFRMMSGTSVSTPIAVGMVSMILAFLNQTNVWSQNTKRQYLKRSTERRLRSTRGMGRLLEKLCRDRNGIKILSPKLMWEHEQELSPLQVLGIIAQYEADRLAG